MTTPTNSIDYKDELNKLILETRIMPKSCDEMHPQFDVYHPDGHEQTLVTIDKRELHSFINNKIKEAEIRAMIEALSDWRDGSGVEFDEVAYEKIDNRINCLEAQLSQLGGGTE